MPDSLDTPDLLPATPTKRESALALVDLRLEAVDIDLPRRVKSPDDAASAYLPYLGWERSVDVYDPRLPESVHRASITVAPAVHRYKGTAHAVEVALSSLQVDALFSEWFEQAPRGAAYTFKVRTFARARFYDGPVLDDRLIRLIYASVMRAKPLSRAFDLTVGATFPRPLGLAAITAAKVSARFAARPFLEIRAVRPLGLAGIALAKVAVRQALRPSLAIAAARPLGVAGVAAARVVVRRSVLLRS